MKTYLGASAQLTRDDIAEEVIAQAHWVYLEGYLLAGESTRAASFHALELARKHGTKIAYSFSDGFLVANFGEHVKHIVTDLRRPGLCQRTRSRCLYGQARSPGLPGSHCAGLPQRLRYL